MTVHENRRQGANDKTIETRAGSYECGIHEPGCPPQPTHRIKMKKGNKMTDERGAETHPGEVLEREARRTFLFKFAESEA